MSDRQMLITGSYLVLPDKVMCGDLLIENGRIMQILPEGKNSFNVSTDMQIIEGRGMYLLPGIIDVHSDAIEKEIEPRPKTFFPINSSFYELERKLAGNGITTIYHSLSLMGEASTSMRSDSTVVEIIKNVNRNIQVRSMIRNRVHLRYEVTNLAGLNTVKDLLLQGMIQLLSFMDHTPGQGQYKVEDSYEQYVTKTYGISMEKARSVVERVKVLQKQVDDFKLKETADLARKQGVNIASHDDDTTAKIDRMLNLGVSISEFPTNLETANYAKSKNIHVSVGAPNIIRGCSHDNNMSAIDAIRTGVADILCSDYYPSALLSAVFKLVDEGIDLPGAVCLLTLNPAKALGLEQEYGSIETGKQADLVLVELYQGHPFIRKTLVGGRVVYQADYQLNNTGGEMAC